MKPPPKVVSLSAEEGEGLIAQVHQSDLPAAVAGRLEQIIRTCFWLVLALQETKITVSRLRRLLFGKGFKTSESARQDASVPSQSSGEETRVGAILAGPGGHGEATSGDVLPAVSPSLERGKTKGGHRPGTGRLGADAYVGAERIECHHEDLAVGQRCPVCGQGA